MTVYALRLENGTDTATRVRAADGLSFWPTAAGIPGARSGVRNDSGAIASVNAGTMSIDISPFSGWLDGGTSDIQGGYPIVSDAVETPIFNAGDATQDRVDTIAVVVNDDAHDGSGLTDCNLVVLEGVPGGGVPSLPASCLPLYDVEIPAGLSSGTGGMDSSNIIRDRRTYIPNGIMRVGSAEERDAASVAARGNAVYRVDLDRLEVWNGSVWQPYEPSREGYKARMYRSGTQTVNNNSLRRVDYEETQYSNGISANLSTDQMTVNNNGVYRITAGGMFDSTINGASDTGRRVLDLRINGAQVMRENYDNVENAAGITLTWEGPLNAGDTIYTEVFQTNGNNIGLTYAGAYLAISEVR